MSAGLTEASRATSEAFWGTGENCCPKGIGFARDTRSEGRPSSGALFTKRGAQLKPERNAEQN